MHNQHSLLMDTEVLLKIDKFDKIFLRLIEDVMLLKVRLHDKELKVQF